MKLLVTTIVISSFLAVAVFGVFSMNHSHDHGMAAGASDGCIASTANGFDCPGTASPFDFLSFHLNAFQSFSRAVFGSSIISLLLLLAVLSTLAVSGTFVSSDTGIPRLNLAFSYPQFLNSSNSPQTQELARWLAIHENSPASF